MRTPRTRTFPRGRAFIGGLLPASWHCTARRPDGPRAGPGGRRRLPGRAGESAAGLLQLVLDRSADQPRAGCDSSDRLGEGPGGLPVRQPPARRRHHRRHLRAVEARAHRLLRLVQGATAPQTFLDRRRNVRARTADRPDGTWTPPADTETNALIRSDNVMFAAGQPAWTEDFSHGEMIRAGVGQTLASDPCLLRFAYRNGPGRERRLLPAAPAAGPADPDRLLLLTDHRARPLRSRQKGTRT
ncbi:non-reducing end alpha-L-arabinofuranosidase family hydrolase [Streptomyces sp. S.PNR 29]|nr:non-reducing end alpha-L-arabinofuranosidase family hydrolase [Streptomyces sp. S.PNR 29]MDN0196505.1 non-reducing end alpha-L-arabinofuranosidase family hydrolase [Streptomyces sp. S.PNR 29]